MKKLNVTVNCMAVYNSAIEVPDNMTINEAIEYAKEHINEIPVGELEYISDSDELDEENCDFDNGNMKKLYYVRTNGYDMLVTYDPKEKIARYANDIDVAPYLGHLDQVEDDSSWDVAEDVEDLEEWLGIGKGDPEEPEILESIDFE